MSHKICVICKQDCSNDPRFKDDQGNYIHESCYNRDQEQKAQPALAIIQASTENAHTPNTPTIPSRRSKSKSSASIKTLLFSFEGRVPRKIYWIVAIPIGLITNLYFFIKVAAAFSKLSLASEANPVGLDEIATIGLFDLVFWIGWLPVAFWAGLAISIKRFHDRNKSGWWTLLILAQVIPVIGWLVPVWFIIELGCLRGTDGSNNYGQDPLR